MPEELPEGLPEGLPKELPKGLPEDLPWDWVYLSCNKYITILDILNNIELPWSWDSVSSRDDITMDIVLNNNVSWDWYSISVHEQITMQNIIDNYDKPWVIFGLSENPNFDIKIFIENIDKFPNCKLTDYEENDDDSVVSYISDDDTYLEWSCISQNSHTTIDFIMSNLHLPWCFNSFSLNPSVTMDMINNNLNFPWKWDCLVGNPNVNGNFILKYYEKINLSVNDDSKHTIKYSFTDKIFNKMNYVKKTMIIILLTKILCAKK